MAIFTNKFTKMAEERLLTPEEMYQAAYKRNIAIGEMWLKAQPKPLYLKGKEYKFDFDPLATYTYGGPMSGGKDLFIRLSDRAPAYFTRYSHIKIR